MKIRQLEVRPNIPEELRPLEALAHNLWHSWNWDAIELFVRLNPQAWIACGQNPAALLGRLTPQELEAAARDASYVAAVQRVHEEMERSLAAPSWFAERHLEAADVEIAYFCAEFGLDTYLPIYSGGLGMLAGDHLKSASDLGLPAVGVGLLYQQGYFRQVLTADGLQQERYPETDWFNMPVRLETDEAGAPVTVTVDMAGEEVHARVWRVDVGRVPLYLLDSNVEENSPAARSITSALYGGDREHRLRQELLLGIGGVRALTALGRRPTVFHMNEGHSAFLLFERIRALMAEAGLSFHEAREVVAASSVFTTHTPVPAGNEVFDLGLAERYLAPIAQELGITWEELRALGQPPDDPAAGFGMTPLALRNASTSNAVSKMHGKVSREMWCGLWPGLPAAEMPITSITNGVHTRSWISHEMEELLLRYLGRPLLSDPADHRVWERVEAIPPAELWRVHESRRERLIFYTRERLREQLKRRGAGPAAIQATEEVLDPGLLTVGFARRFATYKRAWLIFSQPERLLALLNHPERPIQIIFAGKAHPADAQGKELIRSIIRFIEDNGVRNRLVFIEDYDMDVGRHLVQGVDVWLNTPRRPYEASGTSGMKAAANGALNLSVLDGWWCEGYRAGAGWAIGREDLHIDEAEGDRLDAEELFTLLERDIVPLFHDRDRTGLPRDWIQMMKASMRTICAYFNTHRMVEEYVERAYLPAHRAGVAMAASDYAGARAAAAWRARVTEGWPQVSVESLDGQRAENLRVGDTLRVEVRGTLGPINPDDVAVEIRYGRLRGDGQIDDGETVAARHVGRVGNEDMFVAELPLVMSGRIGYAARVVARHPLLPGAIGPMPVTWE